MASIPDPTDRLAAALGAIYGWYERVEPTLTAVVRDADVVPIVSGPPTESLTHFSCDRERGFLRRARRGGL